MSDYIIYVKAIALKTGKIKKVENGTKINPKTVIFIIAILAAYITLATYLPAVKNDFVRWDDHAYIYNNVNIRSMGYDFFKWAFTTAFLGNYHPLTLFSHALDYRIWALDPVGHHLTNILFHALNTFFVFILIYMLVVTAQTKAGIKSLNKAATVALIASLLFGIHPIHVESVVWVSERKDVLYSFFFLLSIIFYLKYLTVGKKIFYIVSLAAFVLSLLSKPMAVTLPVVLLIIDFYPFDRFKTDLKRVLVEKIPFFAMSVIFGVSTVFLQHSAEATWLFFKTSLLTRILIAIRGYAFYLYKIALPLDLAPFYPYPKNVILFTVEYAGSLLLALTITALCVFFRRKKVFSALWLYYLITLLPVIGIIQVGNQIAADRYAYLSSLAPFILFGIAVSELSERYSKKSASSIIAIFIITLSVLLVHNTSKQIAIWRDSITFWTHEIKFYPEVPFAYYNLGNGYFDHKKFNEAIKNYTKAIEMQPTNIGWYNNRAIAYMRLNDLKKAIADYEKAIEINPIYSNAYYNMAVVYLELGEKNKAIVNFEKAKKLGVKPAEDYLKKLKPD